MKKFGILESVCSIREQDFTDDMMLREVFTFHLNSTSRGRFDVLMRRFQERDNFDLKILVLFTTLNPQGLNLQVTSVTQKATKLQIFDHRSGLPSTVTVNVDCHNSGLVEQDGGRIRSYVPGVTGHHTDPHGGDVEQILFRDTQIFQITGFHDQGRSLTVGPNDEFAMARLGLILGPCNSKLFITARAILRLRGTAKAHGSPVIWSLGVIHRGIRDAMNQEGSYDEHFELGYQYEAFEQAATCIIMCEHYGYLKTAQPTLLAKIQAGRLRLAESDYVGLEAVNDLHRLRKILRPRPRRRADPDSSEDEMDIEEPREQEAPRAIIGRMIDLACETLESDVMASEKFESYTWMLFAQVFPDHFFHRLETPGAKDPVSYANPLMKSWGDKRFVVKCDTPIVYASTLEMNGTQLRAPIEVLTAASLAVSGKLSGCYLRLGEEDRRMGYPALKGKFESEFIWDLEAKRQRNAPVDGDYNTLQQGLPVYIQHSGNIRLEKEEFNHSPCAAPISEIREADKAVMRQAQEIYRAETLTHVKDSDRTINFQGENSVSAGNPLSAALLDASINPGPKSVAMVLGDLDVFLSIPTILGNFLKPGVPKMWRDFALAAINPTNGYAQIARDIPWKFIQDQMGHNQLFRDDAWFCVFGPAENKVQIMLVLFGAFLSLASKGSISWPKTNTYTRVLEDHGQHEMISCQFTGGRIVLDIKVESRGSRQELNLDVRASFTRPSSLNTSYRGHTGKMKPSPIDIDRENPSGVPTGFCSGPAWRAMLVDKGTPLSDYLQEHRVIVTKAGASGDLLYPGTAAVGRVFSAPIVHPFIHELHSQESSECIYVEPEAWKVLMRKARMMGGPVRRIGSIKTLNIKEAYDKLRCEVVHIRPDMLAIKKSVYRVVEAIARNSALLEEYVPDRKLEYDFCPRLGMIFHRFTDDEMKAILG